MSTNPYIYGWDDQHLEIPILKHLIDPSLYKGDYYVESAAKYFTSWLYPVLAKVITIKQIPTTYLILFLISRYVMFYWVYRLWLLISGSCFTAVCTTLMFFLLGRTDEFLYRSFCHEEFSFMFMFAGLYCFYRDWYLAAAIIFGLGVNSHAIYNLFPMLYMLAFLMLFHPQRFRVVFQTGFTFVIASLPFLLWQIPISLSREVAHAVPAKEWIPLYLLSCPQNFIFTDSSLKDVLTNIPVWWNKTGPYLLMLGLYVFNLFLNPLLRKDKKVHVIMGLSWAILGVALFYDYIQPNRFVLDLNLVRVEQFMRFFLMGYTTIWFCDLLRNSKPWLALAAAVLILACGTTDLIRLFFLGAVSMVFIIDAMLRLPVKFWKTIRWGIFLSAVILLVYALGQELRRYPDGVLLWIFQKFMYMIAAITVIFILLLFIRNNRWLRRMLIIIPLTGQFILYAQATHDYLQLKKNGPGDWEMQRDWEDMQLFVRDHTPKDTMILTPYDMPMGGFRIHSERKVLVCYRDCGIIGFDYAAALEWQNRIKDIEPLKIYTKDRVDIAILKAILKYKIDYVVFMKYYGPANDTAILKKIYENTVFSLYQVV